VLATAASRRPLVWWLNSSAAQKPEAGSGSSRHHLSQRRSAWRIHKTARAGGPALGPASGAELGPLPITHRFAAPALHSRKRWRVPRSRLAEGVGSADQQSRRGGSGVASRGPQSASARSALAAWPHSSCTCNGICAAAWVEHDRQESKQRPRLPGEQALGISLWPAGCKVRANLGDREVIDRFVWPAGMNQVHRLKCKAHWHRLR